MMATKTARASLLDKPNGKFVVGQYPVPTLKSGEVLMKIEMCGICGTDIHTWRAPAEAVFGLEYPISLGHEISGIIESLGNGVTTDSVGTPVKVGDRIGVIPAIHCGKCYFCRIAKTPEKCTDWKTYGTWPKADQQPHFTGGYGDYLYLHDPGSFFIKSTTTAERTAFLEPMAVVVHSMLHAKIKLGDTVVVQGSGPIGLLTTACAKLAGASVVIATGRSNRARVELAREMGADHVILAADMPSEEDRKRFVFEKSLNNVGADVVINTVGTCEAFKECFNFVRHSGTIVEVGNFVDSGTFDFNPCTQLCERGIKIIGSFDNEAEHFVRAMPLIADKRIPLEKLITHRVPLEDVEMVLGVIEKGQKLDNREIVKAMMVPDISERKS
ncbi:MAG: alcohol dehydrogenase catalytic domain-containing protein [Planctomycetes bacterium]|nr:alcohol dehydrogenase catalytic domain-containing protein [Planctomycetota bacterium]